LTTSSRNSRIALTLLLLINLFNYIDRYILAAVVPAVQKEFKVPNEKTGLLASAFLITYMAISPVFGYFADRFSRWLLIGIGVTLWSLASGATGLAPTFAALLFTRCLIGVGEGAYGPAAPTLISDLYPVAVRGKVLAFFYAAIPVGSALGYAVGGLFSQHWHWAFYCTVPPGLLLGAWCFFMKDPPRKQREHTARLADYRKLLKIRSYVIDTLGMTLMTFAIGGISFWMPAYLIKDRGLDDKTANVIFGGIVVLAGLAATLAGGIAGDKLRERFSGSYFLVSALGMIVGFPLFLLILTVPFPMCWLVIFAAVFCLFFNTGPSNTILANVTPPSIRATAFAANIFIIHLFGDVTSPWAIGKIADVSSLRTAFVGVSFMMLLGGLLWLFGIPYLAKDTAAAEGSAT
jgi:MFS transporter, Spinster family, sphingosine-1-phosphate transporter